MGTKGGNLTAISNSGLGLIKDLFYLLEHSYQYFNVYMS